MAPMTKLAFRLLATAVLGFGLLAVPAAAQPHRHLAPPGNSAISQYLETIPTASGGQPSSSVSASGGHGSGGGAGGSVLPASTSHALAAQGPIGAADASMIQATAPSGGATGQSSGSGGSRSRPSTDQTSSSQTPAAPAASPPAPGAVNSVLKSLTGSSGSGGLGVLLPILLAVVFVAGGGLAFWRRRRAAQ